MITVTKIDITWNISLICPLNCETCCVNAVNITEKDKYLNNECSNMDNFDVFEHALKSRQESRSELSFDEKTKLVDNLVGNNDVEINFSGGDPLLCKENFDIIKYAYDIFGKNNIKVTTTEAGLRKVNIDELSNYISTIFFTYIFPIKHSSATKFETYNIDLNKISKLKTLGVNTVALVPLTKLNINEDEFKIVYKNLNAANVDYIEIMRYFPVGRAYGKNNYAPSKDEYLKAIKAFMTLEKKYTTPSIKLQCAIKNLIYSSNKSLCDMFKHSLGIMCDGTLLSSPWAINQYGKPIDKDFVLGNLVDKKLDDILKNKKSNIYNLKVQENSNCCKIFAFLNSKKSNGIDRMFDKTDPLYN